MPPADLQKDTVEQLLLRCLREPEWESAELEQWASRSIYNRSVLEDVKYDEHLRAALRISCCDDDSSFWTTVITHRAAMHPYMPPRLGNFWNRMFTQLRKIF